MHKHLCGGDPNYFRPAPLSDREMNDIEAVKDTTACERDCKCNHGMNFRENLTAYPGVGTWEASLCFSEQSRGMSSSSTAH